MRPGSRISFTATGDDESGGVVLTVAGFDEYGYGRAFENLQWSGTSGTITPTNDSRTSSPAPNGPLVTLLGYTALYNAAAVGTHTVTASDQGIDGTATMVVGGGPGSLARMELTPSSASLRANGQKQFSAKGYDEAGNEVPITAPAWSSTGGTVTPAGAYTAGGARRGSST